MRINLPRPKLFSQVFREVTGAELDSNVHGIATNSREFKAGDLYIALKGKRTDGHTFLKELEIDGCTVALVSEKNNDLTSLKQVIVEDPLTTIGNIANKWRKQFQVSTLGITGTNGKTSTKDLVHHIFHPTQTVHATEKNFNTSIGLPLTILLQTEKHTISILEMGANQPGDISYLCRIAEPTHGLITNIAPAHLEGFGTVEEIAKEKGELFQSLEGGIAFVNQADDRIKNLSIAGDKISYGLSPDCDFPADIYQEKDGTLTLLINTEEVKTQSCNFSFAKNVLAAAAVAITMDVEWKTFQNRVLSFVQPEGRCQVKQFDDITVIDDTYNANLESTIASIDYLNAFSKNGRRFLVFGDMFELGTHSEIIHEKVGEKCSDAHLDGVFTIGTYTVHTDLRLENVEIHKHFKTKDELITQLKNTIRKGDKILFKGSRGMAMETVIQGVFG